MRAWLLVVEKVEVCIIHWQMPSADADLIAVFILGGYTEGTLCSTASAVGAKALVIGNKAVLNLCSMHGTELFNLTYLAAAALIAVEVRYSLTDHAQVVKVGLDAVVGTSAHSNFKLVRQLDLMIALIKALVNLLA